MSKPTDSKKLQKLITTRDPGGILNRIVKTQILKMQNNVFPVYYVIF